MILDINKPHKQVKMTDSVTNTQLINIELDSVAKTEVAMSVVGCANADVKSKLVAKK